MTTLVHLTPEKNLGRILRGGIKNSWSLLRLMGRDALPYLGPLSADPAILGAIQEYVADDE
jgi:hypothetical protein